MTTYRGPDDSAGASTPLESLKQAAEAAAAAAAVSETAAAVSEAAAAASETAAQSAQTAAESAQTASEAALDEFTDLYLGGKASDPSLDNDGNALQEGALYFNTSSDRFYAYSVTSAAWIPCSTNGIDSDADATAITIDSNENVGIGTATPGARLHVDGNNSGIRLTDNNQDPTNYYCDIYKDYNGNAPLVINNSIGELDYQIGGVSTFKIDGSGNVGIGTSSPLSKFNIASTVPVITLSETDAATDEKHWDSLANGGQLRLRAVNDLYDTAVNWLTVDRTALSIDTIAFNVAAGTEAMRINSSGQVGIGVTTIRGNLHVKLTGDATATKTDWATHFGAAGSIILENTNGGVANSDIGIFGGHAGGGDGLQSGITFGRENAGHWGTNIKFFTHSTATSNVDELYERMRISSAGFLGINHTTPNYRIQMHENSSGANYFQFTNDTTGSAAGNGLLIGLDASENVRLHNYYNSDIVFSTNNTERMRILNAGNIGIGQTSPANKLHLSEAGATSLYAQFTNSTSGHTASDGYIVGLDSSGNAYNYLRENAAMFFATNNTLRMTIDNAGYVGIGTAPSYIFHVAASVNTYLGRFQNTNANPYGINVQFSAASPDNNTNHFFLAQDTTTTRIIIYADGDVVNHDGTYGTISDGRLKQDIVESSSQWDDIKAIGKMGKKYRHIKDVDNKGDEAKVMLGWVAQEVEQVSPGLIMHTFKDVEDDEGNVIGQEETLGIKSSILFTKNVMATAEALERIEALEAQRATLEAQVATLLIDVAELRSQKP